MPLLTGKKAKTKEGISANISELHKGKQYKKTAKKHGKKVADRQTVAIAMKQAGKSRSGKNKTSRY